MSYITADDLRKILREQCNAAGSETKWAKAKGVLFDLRDVPTPAVHHGQSGCFLYWPNVEWAA
jgi:hypothetical protein